MPPTMMYSTLWALNNASNSLKSRYGSIVSPSQFIDGGDAFGGRTRQPVLEVGVVTVRERAAGDNLLDHGMIVAESGAERGVGVWERGSMGAWAYGGMGAWET